MLIWIWSPEIAPNKVQNAMTTSRRAAERDIIGGS
jgi:hypothetical protein